MKTGGLDPSYYLHNQPKKQTGSNNLGKDEFLKILIAQLTNQDPTNPMEDKEFIAQMASFTSLEQMTNMAKSMETFVNANKQSQTASYSQMIGKVVTHDKMVTLEDGYTTTKEVHGLVKSVELINGELKLVMASGDKISPTEIKAIQDFNPISINNDVNPLTLASMLIGKKVSWINDEEEVNEATVKSVQWKNGGITYILDDADETVISDAQIVKITN